MKKFVAIYTGTQASHERSGWDQLDDQARAQREAAGMKAWMAWGETHASSIVDMGSPLGKTKRIAPDGVSDIKNAMVGYVIVQAESHDAAARMFLGHPHFSIFPGDSVEIMECLPLPEQ
jgi:hypothetical protein